MTELMEIGRFSRLTGLSVHALRHYDDVDLLRPAEVDEVSGYRRYSPAQIATARLIVELRWLDLPLEDVRRVLRHPTGDRAHQLLSAQGERLIRLRDHLTRQLLTLDRHLQKGITVPEAPTGLAPVQIKISVDDLSTARTFYREAFGLEEQTVRHTGEADYSAFQFGTYGHKDFFLLHLLPTDGPDFDRPGPSTLGFLVRDLDDIHAQAVRAGGMEMVSPQTAEGMPRHSAVRDPFGNCIWLYQG